jgi:hypothetical protein
MSDTDKFQPTRYFFKSAGLGGGLHLFNLRARCCIDQLNPPYVAAVLIKPLFARISHGRQ